MADKQRVAIAAVMAMEPSYLVLDEPTAWLEPSSRWKMLEEVLRWAVKRRAGIVLITHRMDEAQLCRRLYGMLLGHLEIAGTPDDVFQDEKVRTRLALALPEAFVLTSELRDAGLPVTPGDPLDRVAEVLCEIPT
jgi:energy-coupling factor transport system ATP-binding protein